VLGGRGGDSSGAQNLVRRDVCRRGPMPVAANRNCQRSSRLENETTEDLCVRMWSDLVSFADAVEMVGDLGIFAGPRYRLRITPLRVFPRKVAVNLEWSREAREYRFRSAGIGGGRGGESATRNSWRRELLRRQRAEVTQESLRGSIVRITSRGPDRLRLCRRDSFPSRRLRRILRRRPFADGVAPVSAMAWAMASVHFLHRWAPREDTFD